MTMFNHPALYAALVAVTVVTCVTLALWLGAWAIPIIGALSIVVGYTIAALEL